MDFTRHKLYDLTLLLLWHVLHLLGYLWCLVLGMLVLVESYLISLGFLKFYNTFPTGKLRCVAIVADLDGADHIPKIIQLLEWLEAFGLKHICLYDRKGTLKNSRGSIMKKLKNAILFEEDGENHLLPSNNAMAVEFISFADGRRAIAKAANFLWTKYLKLAKFRKDQKEHHFTEAHLAAALHDVGSRGPEPTLLFVYGPARCHLGFPAWRIQYTEIVHMGPLKSIRYGSLVKAIYNFTLVSQNYGK